jgi:hypothetical protein
MLLCAACAFLQRDVKGLEAAAAAAAESPEVTALSASISQKQQQLDKLEGRLNGIKDRLFSDFRWGARWPAISC